MQVNQVLVNEKGEVHVSFLIAKSRVPIKPVSIPWMELTAAVVSVNVTTMLKSELDCENLKSVYYTDNRVQYIRDRSNPEQ